VPRPPLRRVRGPDACVIGDMDLVRPLLYAGIRGAVVAPPWKPARFSRFRRSAMWVRAPWHHEEEFLDLLLEWARSRDEAPVLYYEADGDLLFVSRNRKRLAEAFRFVLPDEHLVEALVDKIEFRRFAQRFELPVPPSIVLMQTADLYDLDGLRFPLVIKPATHGDPSWRETAGEQYVKATEVSDLTELTEYAAQTKALGGALVAQELIGGDETRMESYHVYIAASGEVVAEFTGRKIRTLPRSFGRSTALCLTDAPDVRQLGRELALRIGLKGVAKLDFKRDPDGQLWLLEINPRFTLWNHLGAVAGVNIPAAVYADLTGRRRPDVASGAQRVTWSNIWMDALAARDHGISLSRWVSTVAHYDVKAPFSWDDPLPILGTLIWETRAWLKQQSARRDALTTTR
jgi:D-aspartate ligase